MTERIILCDFDGTITKTDNIISLMKQFAPPEWEGLKDAILDRSMSIEKGVGDMFSLLPSRQKDELIDYLLHTATIREGFGDFVQFAKEEGIPLYIVSGGIDFFVRPLLDGYGPFAGIYCNEADFTGPFISINWPYPCDGECGNGGCGCCKPSVLRSLSIPVGAEVVAIGDSVTDLEMAKVADKVLARDYLADTCNELGIPHIPFESFHDCIEALREGVRA